MNFNQKNNNQGHVINNADPATVLAMVEEIEILKTALNLLMSEYYSTDLEQEDIDKLCIGQIEMAKKYRESEGRAVNKVELTPAKLADIKQKAESALNSNWISKRSLGWIQDEYDLVSFRDCFPDEFENDDQHKVYSDVCEVLNHIVEADPATVLAMVEEIEQLRRMERKWGQMLKNVKDTAPDLETFFSPDAFKIKQSEAGQ